MTVECPLDVGYLFICSDSTLDEVNLELEYAEVYYAMYPSSIVDMLCAALRGVPFTASVI
jgi:hypothetical protein